MLLHLIHWAFKSIHNIRHQKNIKSMLLMYRYFRYMLNYKNPGLMSLNHLKLSKWCHYTTLLHTAPTHATPQAERQCCSTAVQMLTS